MPASPQRMRWLVACAARGSAGAAESARAPRHEATKKKCFLPGCGGRGGEKGARTQSCAHPTAFKPLVRVVCLSASPLAGSPWAGGDGQAQAQARVAKEGDGAPSRPPLSLPPSLSLPPFSYLGLQPLERVPELGDGLAGGHGVFACVEGRARGGTRRGKKSEEQERGASGENAPLPPALSQTRSLALFRTRVHAHPRSPRQEDAALSVLSPTPLARICRPARP